MKNYIKILDKEVAVTFGNGGFLYTEEKINNNQTVYVFEDTQELREVIALFNKGTGEYQDYKIEFIEDNRLIF